MDRQLLQYGAVNLASGAHIVIPVGTNTATYTGANLRTCMQTCGVYDDDHMTFVDHLGLLRIFHAPECPDHPLQCLFCNNRTVGHAPDCQWLSVGNHTAAYSQANPIVHPARALTRQRIESSKTMMRWMCVFLVLSVSGLLAMSIYTINPPKS